MKKQEQVIAIVPAAGVGKRMKARCPKQYLDIHGKTVLEHTVNKLLLNECIDKVIVALSDTDEYFQDTLIASHPNVIRVDGGAERVDSVLAGLTSSHATNYQWALVHDAARPCVDNDDIKKLIEECLLKGEGGLLAYPVRDTMKRAKENHQVAKTVSREQLWHALTPQMYKREQLIHAIQLGLADQVTITDESSAIESAGGISILIEASSENIKITRPDDLALASFILKKQQGNS